MPTVRIISILLAIWAAIQIGYLAFSFSSGPPSATAELMNTRREATYVVFMVLHVVIFLVFVFGAFKATAIVRGLIGWSGSNVLYVGLVLALGVIFLISLAKPKYEIFVDTPNETVIRRDTHLLPPGVQELSVAFGDIGKIQGQFVKHQHEEDEEDVTMYHFRLDVVTREGQVIEIGWGDHQFSASSPPQELNTLANAIADKSGAELELQ